MSKVSFPNYQTHFQSFFLFSYLFSLSLAYFYCLKFIIILSILFLEKQGNKDVIKIIFWRNVICGNKMASGTVISRGRGRGRGLGKGWVNKFKPTPLPLQPEETGELLMCARECHWLSCGVVFITTLQLQSKKPELRSCANFCACQNFVMVRTFDSGPDGK